MNKKGFTLAELLGVIIILGVLVLVVVTPIVSQINKSKDKLDSIALELIYNTVDSYMDLNKSNYTLKNGNEYYIPLGVLIDDGLMEKDYVKAYNADVLSENSTVKVTVVNNTYKYELLNNNSFKSIWKVTYDITFNTFDFINGKYFLYNTDNNYVVYSGLLWRILGTNNDKSIRLILAEDATTLIPTKNNILYYDSYIHDWLNNDFYSMINNNDLIVNSEFCTDKTDDINVLKNTCDSLDIGKVGLLTLFEANNITTVSSTKHLIRNYTNYLTMTQKNDFTYYKINEAGLPVLQSINNSAVYIRPVISISQYAIVLSGNGSIASPYYINKDISKSYSSLNLNDITLPVGSYITYNSQKYRVMEFGNEYYKIVTDDIITSNGKPNTVFSTDNQPYNINNGAGFTLNNSIYTLFAPNDSSKNFIYDNFIFNGKYYPNGSNYISTSLKNDSTINGANIGMLKAGDMFAAPTCINNTCTNNYWLQTEYDANNAYVVSINNPIYGLKTSNNYLRATLSINANTKITGGNGTKENPIILDGK